MAGSIKRYSTNDIIEALKLTKGSVPYAAKHLGCTKDTIYKYMQRYPAIAEEKKQQDVEFFDTAKLQVWSAVQRGDLAACFFVLRMLGKDHGFSERTEVTGKDGGPIQHAHIHLWEERLQAVHAEMAQRKAAILLKRAEDGSYGQPEETA